ncbi:MAG: type 4a pilus biogenesis protein PilO [Pseudomonadales bacterium]
MNMDETLAKLSNALPTIAALTSGAKNFDLAQLGDLDNLGSWPAPIKVVVCQLAFLAALASGYMLHITDLRAWLAEVQAEETQLRENYELKHGEAVYLEAYRQQQQQMETSYEQLLRQFPADAEMPGLIEDITTAGLQQGLVFERISLEAETRRDFYIETPIDIVVQGGYHSLGRFLGQVADLPRLVTLHDFAIHAHEGEADARPGSWLTMQILARTYRYADEQE